MVASYTKAAAAELIGRNLPIPKANVGTLHSLCHRNLGTPEIAEAHIKEWDTLNPHLAIGGIFSDEMYERGQGEGFLNKSNVYRAKLIPFESWPDPRVQAFYHQWEEWKISNQYMDYTDLLEHGIEELPVFPGKPEVLFVDEAQDLNPLMMKLVRQWGEACEFFILSGDPDQTIFSHVGSSYEQFANTDVPDERIITLDQSYRVPQVVQRWAVRWISQITDRRQIEYKPRSVEGEIRKLSMNLDTPEDIIADMRQYIEQGKSIMFLTSCGYMLNDIRRELRDQGIPFHNPYRASEPLWNPLSITRGISTSERLRCFFRGPAWICEDATKWVDLLKIKPSGFFRGTKSLIEARQAMYGEESTVTPDDIFDERTEEGQAAQMMFVFGDDTEKLNWLLSTEPSRLKAQYKKSLEFPVALIRRAIEAGLSPQDPFTRPPQVILGTMHSVKGGQADVVYLCPDISARAQMQWLNKGQEGWKSIVRTFYVGATRARETLVLLDPSTRHNVTEGGWTV